MPKLTEKFFEYRDKVLTSARAAHGHLDGATDVDVLCLRISSMAHMNSERISVMSLNAKQAAMIDRLEREKRELIARIEGDGVSGII